MRERMGDWFGALCAALLAGPFERQTVPAWGAYEQAPVDPSGSGVVQLKLERDACRTAPLDRAVDVSDPDLPGQHARRVLAAIIAIVINLAAAGAPGCC